MSLTTDAHTVGKEVTADMNVSKGSKGTSPSPSKRRESNKGKVGISDPVLWHENFDIESIVTPVRVGVLKKLLQESRYPQKDTDFLVEGFTHGFKLGYEGPKNRQTFARNHKLRAGNGVVLWNKIMKEVESGRISGPYLHPPFQSFIQSPITLIEKKGSESLDPLENTRLIFDLSYPKGESLNDYTPESVKKVKYPLFDKAINMCLKEGKSCFLSKTDCKSAFLMLPLAVDQFQWVVMKCPHPRSSVTYYFCLKTVCFGSGMSCFLYMKLSNALAHIFRHKTGGEISNLLDDFLTCKQDAAGCNRFLLTFIDICRQINLPLAEEKTCFACQLIVFLGLLIDTVNQTVSIPEEKLGRGRRELDIVLRSKKVTVHQLQKLTGLLNFFCRAVVPGRAFTRRLYAKMGGMKKYHHLRVDREMRADCRMWLEFLKMDEAVCRPFLDFTQVFHADQLNFFTDGALDEERMGVGGCYLRNWFSGTLRMAWYQGAKTKITIQMVELYGVVLALSLWIHKLSNKRVLLFCDNEAVMHMINKSSSSCKVCMIMLRLITLWSMKFNTRIFCSFVKSGDNTYADLLSRGRIPEFLWEKGDEVNEDPDNLSPSLWPFPVSWLN